MFIVALAIMTVLQFKAADHDRHYDTLAWGATFVFNAMFLPISFLSNPFILGPAWSLFCEAIANILYAPIAVTGMAWKKVIGFVCVGAAGVAASAFEFGKLDLGWDFSTLQAGIARVLFSFFVGVIIFTQKRRLPTLRLGSAMLGSAMVCIIALVALLCETVPTSVRPYYDMVAILAMFPLVVAIGSGVSPPQATRRACEFLGAASYPAYVLHLPLAWIAFPIIKSLAGPRLNKYISPAVWLFVASVTVLAWVVAIYIDQPLRRRISRKLIRRPKVAVAVR
jgi:peptidoglycan/LPS O-acetylase OafA/YrhL